MKKIFFIQVLLLSISFSEICDFNNDNSLNIVDIVIMVDSIINNTDEFCDMNGDNVLNVVDVIQLINTILYGFNIEFITIEEGQYRIPGSDEIININYDYQIGKYEITNQQYLSYLNNAILNNQIWIDNCIDNIGQECINGYYLEDEENIEKSFFILGNPRNYEVNNYYFGVINWNGNEFIIEDVLYLDHPVVHVSWYGAKHFADYNGFKLPTYGEWIRAARAESSAARPFSGVSYSEMHLIFNVLNSQYNLPEGFVYPWDDGTTPVGFYKIENNMLDNSSSLGLYDVIGNVSEWIIAPVSYNEEVRLSLGGGWDWALYNSRLKWLIQHSSGQPTWSTGFRVVIN